MTVRGTGVAVRWRHWRRPAARRQRPAAIGVIASLVITLGVAVAVIAPAEEASAAPVVGFDPGDIISDAVFFNSTTMSAADVQSFLNLRGASCSPAAGNTCLKDYSEQTSTIPADAYCNQYVGAGVETAAQIIAKVAAACKINPQVLLVTLQKEQSLVTTTTGKSPATYRRALGFGCPDNSGGWCDPAYAGFFIQVYRAARVFQVYKTHPSSFGYLAGANNRVLYNPNTACGYSTVYIKNQATAGLYNYTPYQPNAAALAAGYGTGDSCSSYGNRNFYLYFTAWFGSTHNEAAPIGRVDSVSAVYERVTVTGWAFDPDVTASIRVHIRVDGTVVASIAADKSRPDVDAAYGNGANHGFSTSFATTTGVHEVCAAAVDSSTGVTYDIGCQRVSVVAPESIWPWGVGSLVLGQGSTYHLKYSISSGAADVVTTFGLVDDPILVGDWNGDGTDTLAARRGNVYHFTNSTSGTPTSAVIAYGRTEDTVLVGDWDGDGKDTLAIRRGNLYYFKNSIQGGAADTVIAYGRPEDTVLVGDWDGDGKDSVAVRRGNVYYIKNSISSGQADTVVAYGRGDDVVIVGDWDGDGKDTLGIRRDNVYYFKNAMTSGVADTVIAYGRADDTVLVGDWNGAGQDKLGARR